jgi:hypothetical protein
VRGRKRLENWRLARSLNAGVAWRLAGRRPHRTFALAAYCALATACASTGSVPKPFPLPGAPSAGRPPDGVRPGTPIDDYALTATALRFRGTPYRNGGSDPSGFDCSGFTQYVFAQYGVRLPREVRDQYRLGRKVKARSIHAGDLLFFTTVAPGASHVGIAVDTDQFVHAPTTNGVVRVERLSQPYWKRRFVGARRIQ